MSKSQKEWQEKQQCFYSLRVSDKVSTLQGEKNDLKQAGISGEKGPVSL